MSNSKYVVTDFEESQCLYIQSEEVKDAGICLGMLDTEDEGTTLLQNFCNYLPVGKV
jgi:hypothetical protein